MNEIWVTVTGQVVSDVQRRTAADGVPLVRLRLAVSHRGYDVARAGWQAGQTSCYTVWARRELAINLQESVARGDPLLVRGRLWLRTGEREDGRWYSADLEAVAAGHNLALGAAAFRRVVRPRSRPLSRERPPGRTAGAKPP